jgi:copper transport protein
VLWPQVAEAHARPVATTPADGQVLAEAPETLTVTFNEPVSLAPAGNQLLAADGTEIEAAFSVRDRVLTIEPSALGRGTHIVAWRVVSADAHPVAGGFTFSVGERSATSLDVPVGEEQREVRVARTIATGLQYAGLLGLAGLVGFVVLVAPPAVRRHDPVRAAWLRAAVVFAALAAGGALLLVPLTALWESGEPLGSFLAGSTWSTGLRGPTATSALLVVGGVVASLVGMRRQRDVLALGGAAAALAALAVSGHTRSYGPSWLVLSADLVHLATAAAWWGGLVALVLALTPRPRLRATVSAPMVARFSTVAAVLVVALVVAGVVLYWRIGHSVSGLWETPYGRAVLVKSGLVLPVLVLAGWNHLRLVPRISSGDVASADSRLMRTMRVEAVVLATVVGVSGVLVSLTPPAREPEPPAAVSVEQGLELDVGDGHRATVVMAPARRGTNGVRVTVTDLDGATVPLAGVPTLSFRLLDTSVGPLRRPASRTAAGVWEATVDLPLPGTWEVSLAVPLSQFEEPVVTGRIEIP